MRAIILFAITLCVASSAAAAIEFEKTFTLDGHEYRVTWDAPLRLTGYGWLETDHVRMDTGQEYTICELVKPDDAGVAKYIGASCIDGRPLE